MDESEIEASLNMYKEQLRQVEQALQAAGPDGKEDLGSDLSELIKLTEDSLLSLKKSKLLAMLGDGGGGGQATAAAATTSETSAGKDDADDEYAAFQASLVDDVSTPSADNTPASTNQNSPLRREQEDDLDLESHDLGDISGTKCRAPFSHDWGPSHYHNAMVLCAEPLDAEAEPKVRVLFCNPTHQSLLPCPFFLEGRCKFDEQSCRFSHGHVVPVEKLQEYVEPDYSLLTVGSKCLAKYTDSIWYSATVVDVLEDHQFKVMFDETDAVHTVSIEDLLPASAEDDDSDSDLDPATERSTPSNDQESDTEDDVLPVFLWRPQTTESMGDWEVHTKGIGSKLMAKMGYIVGEGLGKNGKGRAEPVPIQLLPQGKSLDKIMELKQLAGDRDLYDVMKKQKRKQRKVDAKAAKAAEKPKPTSVFDIVNKYLGSSKKGNIKDLVNHPKHSAKPSSSSHAVTHIKEHDLKKKTDKDVNIQIFQTAEEVKNVQKEIARLKTGIARNEGREKTITNQLKQKLSSAEAYLQQLHGSQNSMQKHMKSRRDNKKLMVF